MIIEALAQALDKPRDSFTIEYCRDFVGLARV
jgi:hypothetical protein